MKIVGISRNCNNFVILSTVKQLFRKDESFRNYFLLELRQQTMAGRGDADDDDDDEPRAPNEPSARAKVKGRD